jgi:hypothetical protein
MRDQYKSGYESAEVTLKVFSGSNKSAIQMYYNNMLDKRNNADPNDYDSMQDYDDLMDWYDGALDATEKYLKEIG